MTSPSVDEVDAEEDLPMQPGLRRVRSGCRRQWTQPDDLIATVAHASRLPARFVADCGRALRLDHQELSVAQGAKLLLGLLAEEPATAAQTALEVGELEFSAALGRLAGDPAGDGCSQTRPESEPGGEAAPTRCADARAQRLPQERGCGAGDGAVREDQTRAVLQELFARHDRQRYPDHARLVEDAVRRIRTAVTETTDTEFGGVR